MATTESRTRDYRALLTCAEDSSWMDRAASQVSQWLREKRFDVDLGQRGDYAGPGVNLAVRRLREANSDSLRVELVEENPTGTWKTEILAHEDPLDDGWVSLSVSNSEGKFVNTPRLARYLLEALPLRDGPLEFDAKPRHFNMEAIPQLVEALSSPERHGTIFVAGTAREDLPFDKYFRFIEKLSREVFGLAQVIVLDPVSTEEFERQVGRPFAAPPWTIRTYQPRVAFGYPADARRHRILGTERLGEYSDTRIERLLGEIARQQAGQRAEAGVVQRVRHRFERNEHRMLSEGISRSAAAVAAVLAHESRETATRVPAEQPLVDRAVQHVEVPAEDVREIDRAGLAALEAQLAELQSRLAENDAAIARLSDQKFQLEFDLHCMAEALDEAQDDVELANYELADVRRKNEYLIGKLHEHHDYTSEHQDPPDQEMRTTFEKLIESLRREGSKVVYTGDAKEIDELVPSDSNGAVLRTAVEVVDALDDYARACSCGDFTGGIAPYLRDTPAGYRGFPPGKFAETETAITMAQHGDERIFPVPTSVAESGSIIMKAHFRLARIGMVSPRLHLFDATGIDGKVYIGYIGAHLTNTKTN